MKPLCTGHCQYLAIKSEEANRLMSLKSHNSAFIMGIGHCSAFVAAFTGRSSIVVRKRYFASLGTRYEAAHHDASGKVFIVPILNSSVMYVSRKFR